ncbi:MAG: hypothetical protein ACKVS6_09115 [Planctomycetota bacterium]
MPPADLHLAPLYSYHQIAGGGYAHEALGGIVEYRREEPRSGTTSAREFGIHPLFRHRSEVNPNSAFPGERETSETDVIWPLGHFRSDLEETYSRFFPFWWYQKHTNEKGESETDWSVFPILFGGSGTPENSYFAFFPFFGTIRDFLTYDEVNFILFPIFASTVKNPGNQKSYAILFPFTGWGSGDGGWSWWRVWPLYGHSEYPGHYDRKFVMWPFWHSERNYLDTGSPSDEWMLWPFYGEADRGATHSRTVLWPLFGWNWNDETNYSGWDGPWPFVKFIRNGSGTPYSHSRVLPFYSNYKGDEIDSVNYLWPIVWLREETGPDYYRNATYVVPFFYHSKSKRKIRDNNSGNIVEESGSSALIWPLYRYEHKPGGATHAEALWPLPYPKLRGFRENWWPFFSLYSHDARPDGSSSTRLFLNLFRHESDNLSTRWSIPILGGRASYADGSSEWSVLLGLLRWRSQIDGSSFLLPAFPGPGFNATERGGR